MEIFRKKETLSQHIQALKSKGLSIGFVPTMGALHEGHLTLVRQAIAECNISVVSIFVNPTQFNNNDDLRLYPRKEAQDLAMLEKVGCNIVFAPDEKEMYPEPDTRQFNLGNLASTLEGEFRPGHFNGVVQVVTKLFDIVQPHKAYFGQKDFQQLAIISSITKELNYPIEIVPVSTVRERDGLAMSSRNERLTKEQREMAPIIYQTLKAAVELQHNMTVKDVEQWVVHRIHESSELKVEYFKIVNAENLQPILNWHEKCKIIGCIAVFCGEVRLIDNIFFN